MMIATFFSCPLEGVDEEEEEVQVIDRRNRNI